MADVNAAIQYVLREEDATLSGILTERRDDQGRMWLTRYGIDQQFHPELTNCLFYSSMGSIAALAIAERIYREDYAAPLCVAEMPNQAVADKVLSLGINCGLRVAAQMLQDILGVPGDGRIGPLTLNALDNANPQEVLAKLKDRAALHYKALVADQPQLAEYLKGWLRRAEA